MKGGIYMTDWWNDLGLVKQIFYTIAVPATVILLIQSILSMIGLSDMETDFDGDIGGADGFDGLDGFDELDGLEEIGDFSDAEDAFVGDFRFFTIRGIIAFFSVFGWLGAALDGSLHLFLVVILAFLGGFLAMVLIGYLFYGMTKLQSSGNIAYKNCIGKSGEVYLTIPPKGQGKGKVMLTVQERLIEVAAITKLSETLKSGESVTVTGMLADHTVIVERVGGKDE